MTHKWEERMDVTHARIFADDAGESHFENVTTSLITRDLAPPMSPVPISEPVDAERVVFFSGPQTLEGSEWHPAPKRQFMFVLEGTVQITVSDGETRGFTKGDLLLAEDTHGKGHTGRRPDPEGITAVLVQLD
jgi:quercetin dioxygenase-like cupin family protein